MKKINNRWYDENNNSWSALFETEESSFLKSKSLSNCRYCSDCSDCSYCSDCSGCSNCSDCSDCSNCSGCSGCGGCGGCSEIKSNPQRYITPKIGSRNSQTSIYWTNKDNVQIICGCWRGDIEAFEARVREVHKDNEYAIDYLKQIEIFKMLVNQ